MVLKPLTGGEISPAGLHSPTMKQASTICTLQFYYNMYGEGISAMCKCVRTNTLLGSVTAINCGHVMQMKQN